MDVVLLKQQAALLLLIKFTAGKRYRLKMLEGS
jgi:hypothetical protein